MSEKEIQINPLLQKLRDNPVAGDGENNYFESFDGTKIFYRTWKPSKNIERIVIVDHGMGGHGEFFILLADHLLDQGTMVIAPDYRNHGNSEGKRGDLKKLKYILRDLNLFIKWIKEQHPNIPIFLLGESMGGAVSVGFADKHPDTFSSLSGLILFAPAVKLNFGNWFWIAIGMLSPLILILRVFAPSKGVYRTKGNEADGIKNPIHQQYDNEDPLHLDSISTRYFINLFRYVKKAIKIAPQITIPTIIFQGTEDNLISPDGVRAFYNHVASKDKKIVLIKGGFHSLFTDPGFPEHWPLLIEWLKTH